MRKIAVLLIGFIVVINSQVNAQKQPRQIIRQIDSPVRTPGYYFVEPGSVAQDSQSAAITLTVNEPTDAFPPVPVSKYKTGMQVVFITKVHNGNNGNITLQINALGAKKLLTRRGVDFLIGELDSGIIITATYDSVDFRCDFDPPPEFRFAEPNRVTRTGDDYTVTDNSLPPVATSPLLLGLKATATNTGNVTLSVNGSTDYPVFFSNGKQIPAGVLVNGTTIFLNFSNVGAVGFRAINLHAPRTLRGQHIATATIPVGDTTARAGQAWTLESSAPAGITVGDLFGETNSGVFVPVNPLSSAHIGWYIELLKDDVVIDASFQGFGQPYAGFLGTQLFGTNNAGDDIDFIWGAAKSRLPYLYVIPGTVFNIAADDDIKFKVYVAEN